MTDDAVTRYVQDLFAPEDEVLRAVRRRHAQRGLPEIFISPEEAQILVVLLRAVAARRVLEIGSLGGYSGVWIARALPSDGELVTIECDERHAEAARESFEAAGVSGRVTLMEGAAADVLGKIDPWFDAVFLDADKAPLPEYFRAVMPLLRLGGLLLCDNAFLDGRVAAPGADDPDVRGMRAFNRLVAEDPRLVAAAVPVRDGLTVAVKVGT